jgi:hypothetical protein
MGEEHPYRDPFIRQLGDEFPDIVVVIQLALGFQQHDGFGGEHFGIRRELEGIIDTERILLAFAQVAPTEGFLVNHPSLFGIKHYAIKSCLIQTGEHLVGLLGAFGRDFIVQVDEKAVNINVRHDTIAPFSEEENSDNHYDEQQ